MEKKLTEEQIERMQTENVFCLGGDELHEANAEFPDEWDGIVAHWYEGPPEYAEELQDCDSVECETCKGLGFIENEEDQPNCDDCDGSGSHYHTVRTAIVHALRGFPEPPKGYEQIGSFMSSGESECWWCGPGTDWDGSEEQSNARTQDPETNTGYRGKPSCPLCEGSGYVYIGDGHAEVIYRSIEPIG